MSLSEKKKVVICGITGTQGGWVYEALKDDPQLELVGFSRNVPAARAKLGTNVTILEGNLDDLNSLQPIFAGADYVFGMTQPWKADYSGADVVTEVQQGANIVQACVDAKVKHLVFSSVDHGAEKGGIPHVDSKIDIEEIIRASGISHTILLPVQFADNFGSAFFPVQPNGWIRGFVDADAKVPYISCRDIGLLTKAVLQQPSKFANQSIRALGDLVSGDELAAIFTKLRSGHDPTTTTFRYYAFPPKLVMRLFAKEFYLMRLSFEDFGRNAKHQEEARKQIQALKDIVPDLSSMEDHLRREGWATKELVSAQEKEAMDQRKRRRLYIMLLVSGGVAVASIAMRKRRA
jgi:uncharacterized protein YbjT (DUF2867 family)